MKVSGKIMFAIIVIMSGVVVAGFIIANALLKPEIVVAPTIEDGDEVCITGLAIWPEAMPGPLPFVLCGEVVEKHYTVEGEVNLQGGG